MSFLPVVPVGQRLVLFPIRGVDLVHVRVIDGNIYDVRRNVLAILADGIEQARAVWYIREYFQRFAATACQVSNRYG